MAKLQSTKGGASPSIQGIKRTKTTTPEKSFRFMLLGVSIPRILARWQSSYPWIKNLPETNADQTMSRPPGRSKVVSPGNVSRAGTSGPNPTPVASETPIQHKLYFKLHMRIHLDPGQRAKPNACGQCDYTTDNKGHFNQHMRTHLDPGQRAKLHACGSATTQPITRAISSSTCAPTPHPRGNSSYHRLDGYACGDYDQKMHRPYGLTILLSKVQIVCASNTMDSFLRTKFK